MDESVNSELSKKLQDKKTILDALNRAGREAVLTHARAGFPVCESRDGKVVWVSPEEVFRRLGQTEES